MTRNEAREIMMQILYELDACKAIKNDITSERNDVKLKACNMINQRLRGGHVERAKQLVIYILDKLDEIDQSINECSSKWKTSRMPKVDLAIMRLALGEIQLENDIPDAVSINEAINLAKKFSTESSAKFIHGVLGAIICKQKGKEIE